MFSKKKKMTKSHSIVVKVTRWYAVHVAIIFLLMFIAAFVVSGKWASYTSRITLAHDTVEQAADLNDFESVDDGTYFAIYGKDKKLERGTLPEGFKENAPISENTVSKISSDGINYYYFDTYNADKQKWVRGIHSVRQISYELKLFLISLAILAPISLIIMALGGIRILNKGFLPIKDVARMAEDITESRDYTKRIDTSYKNSYDETARLAKVFNSMVSSVQANFEKEKQFNQNVSHELRTPLSVIMAESEFGAKYADDLESAKDSLEIIYSQAKLMRDMTEQILELSKIEQFGWSDLERLSLSEIVSEYCREHERKWAESGFKFETKIDSNIWINGHKLMLIRALDNLVSNAIKFSKSEIAIRLKQVDGAAVLTVSDDGIGISSDHLAKIWDRFYQVDKSRNKEVNSGLGLGLSFVREIAELHRAEFKIVSKEGDGTEFCLIFTLC